MDLLFSEGADGARSHHASEKGLTARHGDYAIELGRSELMKRREVQRRAILKSFSN